MQITEHFRLDEFDQAAGHGVGAQDYPTQWIDERLRPLCGLLERVRAACGCRPVHVICGYRSPAYNAALAAAGHQVAEHSQHMEGRAADLQIEGMTPAQVHQVVFTLHQDGQLAELGGLGIYPEFVHVDVRPHTGELARWTGSRSAAATQAA